MLYGNILPQFSYHYRRWHFHGIRVIIIAGAIKWSHFIITLPPIYACLRTPFKMHLLDDCLVIDKLSAWYYAEMMATK